MLQKIRKAFITKVIAAMVLPGLLLPYIPPANANGGPTDNNYSGATGGQLVDMSSGSFSYNIPLLTVGQYPIQLGYNSSVTMEQQASMVGLGWGLNLGAINRAVRGFPDDFDGDTVTTIMNLRPTLNVTTVFSASTEIVGADFEEFADGDIPFAGSADLKFGYSFSNYTGNENIIGVDGSFGLKPEGVGPNAFLNGGLTSSSRSGLSSNLGLSLALGKEGQYSASLGINRNTLNGSSLDFGYGFSKSTRLSEKRLVKHGANVSGSYPLGMQSYTPTATFDFNNRSWSFDIAAGGLVYAGIDIHGGVSRTQSTVCLADTEQLQPAYGYLNLEKGYAPDALQDFNLSLPAIHQNVAGVPTPMPTNDYFQVAGSGSMFRAVRNDAGYVKDPTTESGGHAGAFSGDAAWANGFELGVNLAYNQNSSTSGGWEGNPFTNEGAFLFTEETPATDPEVKARYETAAFVKVNNKSSASTARYNGMVTDRALRQDIEEDDGIFAFNNLTTDGGDGGGVLLPTSNDYYQHERRDRNEVLQPLSNQELRLLGDDAFDNYVLNNFSFSAGDYTAVASKARDFEAYPGNHIGQLTVIGSGGMREVYGLPVMNTSDQVSFNISAYNNYDPVVGAPALDGQGLVEYLPGIDNSTGNKRGGNHYYLKNHVPPHATSYLLTQQLSDNYVDRTGNGPTPDDYGAYTKFNYAYNGVKNWRFPYTANKATYNEGFKSNPLDDMASYAYGERDEWYVHSIETKDYIAEFVYSNRQDAYGVADENGGLLPSAKAKKLDQIKLFTRKGKEFGEGPIKTVHFLYDYSLCPQVPDNTTGAGKLTLKGLYFEGQDSPQGALNKYEITYAANANYAPSQLDRWGTYQAADTINYDHSSSLDNQEYPYTHQNRTEADANVQKWKLSAIGLPTGGRIEINYEAHDYEYIQNREATRMYMIGGFYATDVEPEIFTPSEGDFGADLYDPDNDEVDNFYIMVDLDDTLSGSHEEALVQFGLHFLPLKINSLHRYLYFNTLLNLAPHNDGIVDPDVYEYVQGYAEIEENGWYLLETSPESEKWTKVVFRVKPELLNATKASSPKMHPISRKGGQLIKDALPLVLFPEDNLQAIYSKDGLVGCYDIELEGGSVGTAPSDASKNHKKNLKSVRSVYHMMRKTGYASRAIVPKCWVRMRSGLQSKMGGGARVHSIKTYDNWNDFVAGESSAVYGTRYEYTTVNNRGETISSGVASYENINAGGDEIALRQPHFYVHAQKGTPSERYYTEFPLNETIFSTQQIRYSRIKTTSIDYPGLVLNTMGYTLHENYTAKDYPIQFDTTRCEKVLRNPGEEGLTGAMISGFGISYGTSYVTNNLHGVFKSKKSFSASTPENPEGNLIYSMEHRYWENPDGTLSSEVPTILPDGSDTTRLVGLTTDLLTHLNKNEIKQASAKLNLNFEFSPPLAFLPSAWPGGNYIQTDIYSTLTTKVVYQTGLLKEIMVEDQGRAKYTENLLYDAKTGTPIASEVTPEKGDGIQKIFEYSYPAHWAYPGMGLVSDNIGLERSNITGVGSTILPAEKPYFFPGDELVVIEYTTGILSFPIDGLPNQWVIENEATGDWFLADADGTPFVPDPTKKYLFKVQTPGKANLTGALMASVTSLKKHTGDSPYTPAYPHSEVISITGKDYFENALLPTDPCVLVGSTINPYTHNLLGQWKPEHTYVFDGLRDYSTGDSRTDGLLTVYQPFWQNVSGEWLPIYDPARPDHVAGDPLQDWIQNSAATLYDAYGFGLETKNVLGLYQNMGTGYNQQLQTNTTSNSRYTESGYDGFEDYFVDGVFNASDTSFTPYGCHTRHFGITNGHHQVTTDAAHTGRYSLSVNGLRSAFFFASTWDGTPPAAATHIMPFVVQEADVIPPLRLMTDQPENKYLLTVWAKETNPPPANLANYNAAQVSITVPGITDLVEQRSAIIDGWQRIEITFNLPPTIPNGTAVQIQLGTGSDIVLYDDLRIQPYDSEMNSVAIDALQWRKMAQLDDRDFATSYQYDENGTLVRVIQETERGRQAISETRSGIQSTH
ncbi:MAG: hypothetical protein ACFB10_17955 [Salibacteraceae bacterium]